MIWPLIPYSYDTINYDLPVARAVAAVARNWLGTDDQARDVLARVIYGFRISVLFGLTLDRLELDRRSVIAAGACRAISAAGSISCSSASSRSGAALPMLYLLIILASVIEPNFWWLLDPDAAVQLDVAGRRRARRVPARAQLRLCARGAGARRRQPDDHVAPRPAQRHGRDADLPAVHPDRLDHDAHLARLPWLRPAAGLALARRAARTRARTTCRRPGSGITGFAVLAIC